MFIDTNVDIELGAFLVEKKVISLQQLQDARAYQRSKGGYLSQGLIELGFVRDSSLTTLLTCQYGYSYLPLKAYNIDENAIRMIKAPDACNYLVVPIEKNDKLLTVTMADPLNKGVVEMLRQSTHCEIIVFISTRAEIMEAITKYYSPCAATPLDRYPVDHELRDDLMVPYVSNGLYSGPNRRRFRRCAERLDIDCFLYPNIIKTRSINISLGGALIESRVALPKGTQLAIRMHSRQTNEVMGVVEVNRCVPHSESNLFEIGVFFNFLSRENHDTLSQILRSKLPR